ncbi:MAG: D-alanine--D-alanine ligase [Candidatus Hydrogenedentota bacterium]
MRPKKHILVLMGGISSEHDISIQSGENILANLDAEEYKLSSAVINRDGEWIFSDAPEDYLELSQAVPRLRELHPDCVFIALHGPFGEDGRIQGMLDLLGIPYTGSGCAASALAMDKVRSKAIMKQKGVVVPDEVVFTLHDWKEESESITHRVGDYLGFPCVLKNPHQGSSLGMAIPQSTEEFSDAVMKVFGYGYTIMVERMINGTEVTCGVLDVDGSDDVEALPVTEIRPLKGTFFDYHSKYNAEAVDEITPAEISDSIRDRVQEISCDAHTTLGCRGFSRSDMIISGDEVIWLETNTIPGMTETSLLPKGAAAAGLSFKELLTRIVDAGTI